MVRDMKDYDAIELDHLSHSFDGVNDSLHSFRRSLSSLSEGSDSDDVAEEGGKELYSHVEERAVVKKLDRRLVLFVALLYMLSFLDRSSKFM